MSNYLIATVSKSLRPQLQRWLTINQAPESEYRFINVDGGVLLIMGRDVERCIQDNRFMRGTAVSDRGDQIGYGPAGWPVADAGQRGVTGGEYTAATWSFRSATIWTDFWRAVPLLYTTGPSMVAASDSLLLLVDLRRHLGLANAPNNEAIIARTRTIAIMSQQISSDTFMNEVSWCPPGRHLEITFRQAGPDMTVDGPSAYEAFARTDVGHEQTVREACGVVAGQMRAVTTLDDAVPRLGLTGGRDSRALLAGALRAGDINRLSVHVHNATPAATADYECAHDLAKTVGFQINNADDFDFGPELNFGANTPVAIWATSFLGVYDRLMPKNTNHARPTSIPINGLGAGMAKGAYRWRSVDDVIEHPGRRPDPSPHAKERHEAYSVQFRKGIRALGVPDNHPWASEWYYCAYRIGIHGGAHLASTMLGLRPLTQSRFARLALHPENGGSPELGGRVIDNMLAVLDKELTALPYDTPERAISQEQASAWCKSLGGPLRDGEILEVEVLGRPSDVPLGPLQAGLRAAERMGFDLSHDDQDRMVSVARAWVSGIGDPIVRALFENLADVTENRLKKFRPVNAGPAPAKLLAAGLFV